MFCKNCGNEVNTSASFCGKCGKPIDDAARASHYSANSISGHPHRRMHRYIIAALIGTLGIVFVVSALIVSPWSRKTPSDKSKGSGSSSTQKTQSNDGNRVDLQAAATGDLVSMGSYNLDSSNSKVKIDWIVLTVQDGHALLLSNMAIDCRPISSSLSYTYDITWEKSDIRKWLNGEFLSSFNSQELASIDETTVSNPRDSNTQDKIFLLSATEVGKYCGKGIAKARGTKYAQDNGAATFDEDTVNWWLRDYNPDSEASSLDNHFLNVMFDGTVNRLGYLATTKDIAVRPAMWVSTNGHGSNSQSLSESHTDVDTISHSTSNTNTTSTSSESINSTTSNVGQSTVGGGSTTTLTATTSGGKTVSGNVRIDKDGYVIADSSLREYTKDELRSLGLSDAELCVAWNEPFARLGRHFKNHNLQAYFESRPWYVDTGSEMELSGCAAKNNAFLREIAEETESARTWKNLESK